MPELRQTHSRAERLRKSWQFRNVIAQGRRISTNGVVYFFLAKPEGPSALGVTVGKRVGNAVRRNRVKRLLRDVFRRKHPLLVGNFDVVAIAKPTVIAVQRELEQTWGRAIEILRKRDKSYQKGDQRRG